MKNKNKKCPYCNKQLETEQDLKKGYHIGIYQCQLKKNNIKVIPDWYNRPKGISSKPQYEKR